MCKTKCWNVIINLLTTQCESAFMIQRPRTKSWLAVWQDQLNLEKDNHTLPVSCTMDYQVKLLNHQHCHFLPFLVSCRNLLNSKRRKMTDKRLTKSTQWVKYSLFDAWITDEFISAERFFFYEWKYISYVDVFISKLFVGFFM